MTTILGATLDDVVTKLAETWNTKLIAETLDVDHEALIDVLARLIQPPKLVTTRDAARLMGVPYSTLRDIVRRRELPVVRISRYDQIPVEAIDAWIAARVQPATRGPLAASA